MLVFKNEVNAELVIIGYFSDVQMDNPYINEKNDSAMVYGKNTQEIPRLYVKLGKECDATDRSVRNAYAKAFQECRKLQAYTIELNHKNFNKSKVSLLVGALEGITLAAYEFDKYKSGKKDCDLQIVMSIKDVQVQQKLVESYQLMTSINEARDLIIEPPNKLYPETFAEKINEFGKRYGYEVSVFDEKEIKELGMTAFTEVGQGTNHPPFLVVMRYTPVKGEKSIGLIGKGITCDTGGYCLKGSASLPYIKGDMAGAASVVGIMNGLARNHCQTNVIAVIATCENVVDGNSYKPGAVVETMAGKTVEVVNTDAEGRLTLADAITYIKKHEEVEQVIDLATLTGATALCFGSLYTPVFGNNEKLMNEFMNVSLEVGEDYWEMPLDRRYKQEIVSRIADLKNESKPSTITAAMFLKEFVEDIPWLHLDIAATAVQYPVIDEYSRDVPSGVGIRTIYQLIKNRRN